MRGIVGMYDIDKNLITNHAITHLKLNREKIINKSIEKFNDEDPCIIHETYCINNIAMELINLIETKYFNIVDKIICKDDIVDDIKQYIDWGKYTNVSYIKFE